MTQAADRELAGLARLMARQRRTTDPAHSGVGRSPGLGRGRRSARHSLPRLFVLTDPDRMPDPVAVAARLPRGAGLIYRHFGAGDRVARALALREATLARGATLLIAADPPLARAVAADGVHWPERMVGTATAWSMSRRHWIVTAAAHSLGAIRCAERRGMDAVLASPVFPSRSRSAGPPMGAMRFAHLCAQARLPVIALGGITQDTAPRIARFCHGVAVVEAAMASLAIAGQEPSRCLEAEG